MKLETNYLMLVNRENPLPKDYIPKNLVRVENRKGDAPNAILLLDKKVAESFILLQKAAILDGYDIICDSPYRSFELQNKLIQNLIKKGKSLDKIAPVGTSEHHTGLCLDIAGIIDGKYTDENDYLQEIYNWLSNNSYKFGFIIRYPKEKEKVTGYPYEPWHIRYVGKKVAKEIVERGIVLEEYLNK